MPKLEEHVVEEIIDLLQAGHDLPQDYKYVLFPPTYKTDGNNGEMGYPLAAADDLTGHILVVDDNEFNRDLLTEHLEWQGHTVETALNGEEALRKMRNEVFDLVLLDIMMPVMDGYSVLEAMKQHNDLRHIPVIVISAVSDIQSVVRCVELGAQDYLFKPFDVVLLRARISASLEKKKLRDYEQKYLRMLEVEREKSEHLLLNVLPRPIADKLKQDNATIADSFANVSVLFADIVDFTTLSVGVSATELVDMLNDVFSAFDQLADKHKLEKIKTIGDAYMVVGGLPTPRENHLEAIANMALDMRKHISQYRSGTGKLFSIRIGINSGPVVAGVIGTKKFAYDLWGDTVNIASRMEETGEPNHIQVSSTTYSALKTKYAFRERGVIPVKGVGNMKTYFLEEKLT